MLKNVGGQSVGAQINNINSGQPFVGPIQVYITGDGGTQVLGSVNGGVCVAEGNGYYSYNPSQAETNFNIVAYTFVGVNAIAATVQFAPITEAQQAALSTATITQAIGDGPTRIELLNQVAHRLNKTPPPNMDSATETRLASYLNQRQRRLLSLPGISKLRDASMTFTSINALADYGLPHVAKISRIYDVQNQRVLYEMSAQDYAFLSTTILTGTPEAYVWRGPQCVVEQPTTPCALYIYSTSDSDKQLIVNIEGVVAAGYPGKVAVTLNGQNRVNVNALVSSWVRVDKFFLSKPVSGNVVLMRYELDGTTERPLSFIQAGAVTTVYTGVTLYPTPSAPLQYGVDIVRVVSDMVNGADQTPLPYDFSDLLVLGALADEYQHLQDERWTTAMTEYKERENQLKYWLSETAIGRPLGLSRSVLPTSQLGSYFPAGS